MSLFKVELKVMLIMTLIFIVLYSPRILAWFASFKKQKRLVNNKKNKLAIIIPARNEGKAVLPLFNSILEQTYEKEYFDTFVVVKEYNDPVIDYAKMVNGTVYVDESQTCKGECLDYCIKSILRERPGVYDGYIIVDADCVLDKDFLLEMNNAMASDAQVINAKKLVKNYYSEDKSNCNLVTCCNGIIWTLMDDMGNRFKTEHGYTTMTITTGILLRKDLVESWGGWNYLQTLTEDMELQRDCGVKDYKTFYYSHAKFYMEEAPQLAETNKRRNRWMTGLTDADKIYFKRNIKKRTMYDVKNNYYLYCLWIAYGYIGGLSLIFLGNILSALIMTFTGSNLFMGALASAGVAFGLIYLSFFVMTLFALLIDGKYMKIPFYKKIVLLFAHPVFYMGYINIVRKAIFSKKPAVWEEIKRVEC